LPTALQSVLIEHWSWAAEKDVMNKNTATGLRAAGVQVLGVLDDPDQADVARMDIEDLRGRFRTSVNSGPNQQF